MKTNLSIALYRRIAFLLFFFVGYSAQAQELPEPGPPTPPPVGINQNLFLLFFLAILLGFYIIYNHTLNQRRAI